MPSGGSSSGEIGYPEYMENNHKYWLYHNQDVEDLYEDGDDVADYSVIGLINTTHGAGGNPYASETAFDPDAALSLTSGSPLYNISSQFSATKTILDALDADTDWGTFVDAAYAKTDKFADIDFLDNLATALSGLISAVDDVLDSSAITDAVTAFETSKKARFRKDVSMWSAGMADANAVHTSSFIIGLALMQKDFSDQVDLYEKEMRGQIYNNLVVNGIQAYLKAQVLRVSNQDQMVNAGAEIMSRLNDMKAQMQLSLAGLKAEIEKINMISFKEQNKEQLDIDVNDALWELETYMYAANMLSAISGAAAGRKQPKISDAQSALSGAMAGGSLGSAIMPGIGTAVGIGAGAILGWALN